MTVVSAVINKNCIALASDSWRTTAYAKARKPTGRQQKSKIVRIERLHAAASYWGLDSYDRWSTYDWIANRARHASDHASLNEFAIALRDDLQRELSALSPADPLDKGIGIHITGYELVDTLFIPELFLCTNFANGYARLGDLIVNRETYHALHQRDYPSQTHAKPECRRDVHEFLSAGCKFVFNNGDPLMFNPAAKAINDLIEAVASRNVLREPHSIDTCLALARRPIEIVSKFQRDLYIPDQRLVGGKIHDLVITPDRRFISTSGD